MEEEKKETIATLYALRAGISVLSTITDETKRLGADILHAQKRISELETRQGDLGNEAQEEKDLYAEELEVKKNDLKEAREKLETKKKEKKKDITGELLMFIGGIVASLIVLPLLLYFYHKAYVLLPLIFGWFLLMSIGMMGFGLVLLINETIKLTPSARKYNEEVAVIEKEIRELEEDVQQRENGKENTLITINKKYADLDVDIKREIKEKNDIVEKKTEEVLAQILKFNTGYEAVKNEFENFLDERDWENVDLVIYLYETGRAIDLRDALIQVDMERRNERLISAIRDATKAIAYTIERGFGELKAIVIERMTKLDNSIRNLSNRIAEQTEAMQAQMQRIANIASAQQALQEKISESSDSLARDVSYMKDITHRSYYNI